MEYVYSVESKNKGKLAAVLDADPYAEKSFARLGFTLKSSDSVGLPAGKYFVHFKSDEDVGALIAKLREVETVEEASKDEKKAVVEALNKGLDDAVSGFGSIFG